MNSKGGVVNLSILLVSFNKFIKESMSKPYFLPQLHNKWTLRCEKSFHTTV